MDNIAVQRNKTLRNKLIVVTAVNVLTVALDISLKYIVYEKQRSGSNLPSIVQNKTGRELLTLLTENNVKGVSLALGGYADVKYMTGSNGTCDDNDVENIFVNAWWLTLHLSKTAIRLAEYVIT
jgi:hypothetical protein